MAKFVKAPTTRNLVDTLDEQRKSANAFASDYSSIFQSVRTDNALKKLRDNPNMTSQEMIALVGDGSLSKQGFKSIQNILKLKQAATEFEQRQKLLKQETEGHLQTISATEQKQMKVAAYNALLKNQNGINAMDRTKLLQDNSLKNQEQLLQLGTEEAYKKTIFNAKKKLELARKQYELKLKGITADKDSQKEVALFKDTSRLARESVEKKKKLGRYSTQEQPYTKQSKQKNKNSGYDNNSIPDF